MKRIIATIFLVVIFYATLVLVEAFVLDSLVYEAVVEVDSFNEGTLKGEIILVDPCKECPSEGSTVVIKVPDNEGLEEDIVWIKCFESGKCRIADYILNK